MENNELLFNLQKYDLSIQNVKNEVGGLAGRKVSILNEIKKLEAELNGLSHNAKNISAELVKIEKDIEFIESQIKKLSERFLLIKTEKELSKYNTEMQKLNADKSNLEEKTLSLMEESEKITASIKVKTREIETLKKEAREKIDFIEIKINEFNEELNKLNAHKKDFCSKIPAAALETYNKLFSAKNGTPVSLVARKICSGCHLSISDNILNQVKFKNALLIFCPNCQRILYLE